MMRATGKDIVGKLGVTDDTVTLVLNDRSRISTRIKKRVSMMAKELNYSPNAIARRHCLFGNYALYFALSSRKAMLGKKQCRHNLGYTSMA